MPFTPCHIAAVLPMRRRLPFVALAVGAMVPDIGYYLAPCAYFAETAHTLARSLTFCVPVGSCAVLFLYATQRGWRELLPVHLPEGNLVTLNWLVPVAIWLGVITHLFWDSWTHVTGYFARQVPALPANNLQHLSTVVGGVIVGVACLRYVDKPRRWNGRGIALLAATAALAVIVTAVGLRPGDPTALNDRRWFFMTLTALIGNWLVVFAGVAASATVLRTFLNRDRAHS